MRRFCLVLFGLLLCIDGVNAAVRTVAKRKINDPVLASEGNCRFCNILCQDPEPAPLSAG